MPVLPHTPLRIAICDDETIDLTHIEQMTREILREEGVSADIFCYDSASALLKAIRAGAAFHIFLLDVMMEDMNGMELAATLRTENKKSAIVFISSNREMALQGYEVAAARYLAKPLERNRLREGLLHCCAIFEKDRTLILPTADGQSRIDPSAIVYVEAWERGVRLNLVVEKVAVKIPISQIVAMLPEGQFAYCHRTLLVNLNYVHRVHYCELELKSGERLPVSKYRFAEFKSAFLQHLKD